MNCLKTMKQNILEPSQIDFDKTKNRFKQVIYKSKKKNTKQTKRTGTESFILSGGPSSVTRTYVAVIDTFTKISGEKHRSKNIKYRPVCQCRQHKPPRSRSPASLVISRRVWQRQQHPIMRIQQRYCIFRQSFSFLLDFFYLLQPIDENFLFGFRLFALLSFFLWFFPICFEIAYL